MKQDGYRTQADIQEGAYSDFGVLTQAMPAELANEIVEVKNPGHRSGGRLARPDAMFGS